MKRRNLLEAALTDEKNVNSVVATTIEKDQKFIKRTKRKLEDEIEDDEEQLRQRLESSTPIDHSTVEVMYAGIQDKKAKLKTYEAFEKEYLSTNN